LLGIERVKQLLTHGRVEQKIDALIDALETDEIRRIACVDISQEWQTLATYNYNNTIQVWNMRTQQVICIFQPEATKEFDQIAIAPNNRVLGLWYCLDLAEVWDLKIGQKIFTTNIQSEEFWRVSFSPDGQALVSTRDGYKLTFWDVNEQKIIPSIFIPENIHCRYPIYSNSQILVTEEQGFDQNYEIWDWQTQQVICTLSLSGYMPVITVSRDQRFLVSGSRENGTIKVWNIRTGHQLYTLTSNLSSITGLAISSDGQRLFVWSGDSTIEVWGI